MSDHPAPLRIGSFCSGYRGLDAAVEEAFGATTAWVSDVDPGANAVLAHRWPTTPNIGDLTTADYTQVEPVDIVCGGYPCQPFSLAGKRKGTQDERHIWPYIADALRVLRPRIAIFENVAGHLRLGFADVLADLARLGFDAEWCLVRASEVGAPHRRERLFILAVAADADGDALRQQPFPEPGCRGAAVAGLVGSGAAADSNGAELGRQQEEQSEGVTAPGNRRAPADTEGLGHRHTGAPGERGMAATAVTGRPAAHADADSIGRRADEPDLLPRQPDAAWGRFLPAIQRWEAVTGRCAPRATDDRHRLSPAFVEWMMGLPSGHVTAVPELTRTQQLKALGNGVVPQQAAAALRLLRARACTA
ncbi:DNA cytosine methyltransferase [Streptomyces sp. NPDC002623]